MTLVGVAGLLQHVAGGGLALRIAQVVARSVPSFRRAAGVGPACPPALQRRRSRTCLHAPPTRPRPPLATAACSLRSTWCVHWRVAVRWLVVAARPAQEVSTPLAHPFSSTCSIGGMLEIGMRAARAAAWPCMLCDLQLSRAWPRPARRRTPGILRSRFWRTTTATWCTYTSATARCSVATRRCALGARGQTGQGNPVAPPEQAR